MSVSGEITGIVAGRVADRTTSPARARAEAEARSLIEAALAVLRRQGAAGLTVAEVLAEAGLSTRVFYRHFASKDELLLALFDADNEVVRGRVDAAIARRARPGGRAARAGSTNSSHSRTCRCRSRRTQVLWAEGRRLQLEFPAEFERIFAAVLVPLERLLAAGRANGAFPTTDPARDALCDPRGHLGSRRSAARGRPDRSRVGTRADTPLLPPRARSPRVTDLPALDSIYFDEEWETMSRERIEEEQLALLLDAMPYVYEHSPLVRETWDAARVHPRDVTHARRLPRTGAVHRQGRGTPLPRRARRPLRRAAVRRSGRAHRDHVDVGHDRRPDAGRGALGRRRRRPADDHHPRLLGHGPAPRRPCRARSLHLPRARCTG